ncbi:MAG TPA: efflux RND transporter periplasmic adaptor subunit [Anaeromyxobacter sp.]|nr:efflux RND transporter periplasmic adaptor subunit [Anaeromyxobacter sp.]
MTPTPSRSARLTATSSTPVRAALAVALVAALACGKKEEAKAPPPPEVTVTDVVQRDVAVGGELTATLRGFEDIEIRARVEGYLKGVDYKEGSEVKKGQLLFTIDDQPYRAKLAETKGELARAQSMLAKADLDVARFKPLAEQRAISQAELDNAIAAQRSSRAQVDAARAAVEKASLDLGYCRIASPIDGLAGQAQRKVGDLVGKGEATLLTTISSIDPVRVSVNIPEALYLKYASKLPSDGSVPETPTPERPGAELVLADGSVYPERGYIVLVDRAVDPQTGTLRADLAFKNPKKLLRPGLYGKVKYAADRRAGALLVPQRSVLEVQGQYSVVVVDAESKGAARTVKVGPRIGSLWIVEDGLKAGEKVVVEGAAKVKDGMVVKATAVPPEPLPPEGPTPAPGATAAGAPAPAAPGGAQPVPASTGSGPAPTPAPPAAPPAK